jgi:hypothetical protein
MIRPDAYKPIASLASEIPGWCVVFIREIWTSDDTVMQTADIGSAV